MYFQLLYIQTGFWCGKLREGEDLGRPKRGSQNNIKMDFQEMEWWHGLDQSGSE
jgi:hypothetical protein